MLLLYDFRVFFFSWNLRPFFIWALWNLENGFIFITSVFDDWLYVPCLLFVTVVHKGEDYSDISVCFFIIIIIIPLYMKIRKTNKKGRFVSCKTSWWHPSCGASMSSLLWRGRYLTRLLVVVVCMYHNLNARSNGIIYLWGVFFSPTWKNE